ncbi:3-isopropylmalate dehydrogenase [Diplodia seriata]|uniref:3-isopropylmalate dehydrogenase n=1 Tax=Diplodia seriata TaxID=420778 RepID=A0A1S8B685_9PEZI|nr:3-isopropylmalate dehydrogenase [Diplodia seriata]
MANMPTDNDHLQVKDTDFLNVIQDIKDIAHHTAATSAKARPGLRTNHASELRTAQQNLSEDIQRLVRSPHVQREQPALGLSGDAIAAMRSLWTAIQAMKRATPEDVDWDWKTRTLDAAVCQAINTLDPKHPLPEKGPEESDEKTKRKANGDHCGPEVLEAIQKEKPDVKFNFQHHLLGGASIDATGEPLTDEALAAAKNADAVLLGAIGGPKWGTGKVRPEQGILKLRKEMGTFGNLRPCFFASESLVEYSPLKAEVCRGTNFNIIRELTGGIYFGDRKEDDGSGFALDTEPYSREEIERVTRLAANLALQENPPAPVWSLDKANVLATSRLWRKVFTEIMEKEFPQLTFGHHLIDSAAMLMVKNPRALNGVIVTSNLFGDIISDEASVIPGSLGLLPSASVGAIPDGKTPVNGIYEPIHGSAPDISGKGIVNPIATILSVSMMLKYSLCQPELATAVDVAVKNVLDNGVRTADIKGTASTKDMGDAVVAELTKLLKK